MFTNEELSLMNVGRL